MTGYNHYPWCSCGWCNGGGGGGYSLSVHRTKAQIDRSEFEKACNEAKTHMTVCWWCGDTVYYHTNGYNDHVLFDNLGWPWPVHQCWQDYWDSECKQRKLLNQLNIKQCQTAPKILNGQSISERDKRKIVIKGAVQCLEKIQEPVTDQSVASLLGLTPESLYRFYGDLYELYRQSGKVLLRLIN